MIRLWGAIMATIEDHLSGAELEARYKAAADPVAKSHFHALWLLSSGYGIAQVAELLSFSTRWIRLLINRYNQDGPEALGDRRAGNGRGPENPDARRAGGAQGAGQNAARRRRPVERPEDRPLAGSVSWPCVGA